MSAKSSSSFQLGEWHVDSIAGRLSRGDEVRRARPVVLDLLLLFVSRAGEVVSKDDLITGAWRGAAITDSVLTSTVAELRDLLGDEPKRPRYIETIPKRGYCLIAAVAPITATTTATATTTEAAVSVDPGPVDAATTAGVQTTSVVATSARRGWTVAAAFALGTAFAFAVTMLLATRRVESVRAPAAEMRLHVSLPPGLRLTTDATPKIALSNDGSRLLYVVRETTGPAVYMRTLGEFDARPIGGTDDASVPFFSFDGSRIGFFASGELRVVPATGGRPSTVCQARVPLGAAWTPDDMLVFSAGYDMGLFEVPVGGGTPVVLTTLDRARGEGSHRWPSVLPGGRAVLFTAVRPEAQDIAAVSRDSHQQHVVLENARAAAYLAPDRLIYERAGRLFAAPFDPIRLVVTGPGVVVVDDVADSPGTATAHFVMASGGPLVYVPADPRERDRELVWVDRSGAASPVGAPVKSYMHPRLSPDGRQILTWIRGSDEDLWLFDRPTGGLSRFVTGVSGHRGSWSPDGTRVLFDGAADGAKCAVFTAAVTGGRAERVIGASSNQCGGAWMPNERAIVLRDFSPTTGFDLLMTPIDTRGGGAMTPLLRTPANETAAAFSPDGHWFAFVSDASGREEVYLLPYPVTGTPLQISIDGGREPVWSRSGGEVFYRHGDALMAVRVGGGRGPRLSNAVTLFEGDFDRRPSYSPNYDVASDGRFLMVRSAAPPRTDTQLAVLLNWQGRLAAPPAR